jgi:hypothetical protein
MNSNKKNSIKIRRNSFIGEECNRIEAQLRAIEIAVENAMLYTTEVQDEKLNQILEYITKIHEIVSLGFSQELSSYQQVQTYKSYEY